MKIIHINTYDVRGGAARAAYRLHRGMLQLGEDSLMIVKEKTATDASVVNGIQEVEGNVCSEGFFLEKAIQEKYINANRTDLSNTNFSLPYPGYDLSGFPQIQEADVLNLHWIAHFQSPVTLSKIFALGKPVVWTLHDMRAFTGGCHYSAGCNNYFHGCETCPQLAEDPFGLTAAVLKDSIELLQVPNLTIASPSQWLAECAAKSKLFKNQRIEVIPNALETQKFEMCSKPQSKEAIGVENDTLTLLFGGEDGNEKRKGFDKLIEVMHYCLNDSRFRSLVEKNKIKLICFGNKSKKLDEIGIPVFPLGYLDSDKDIINAYSAADIFLLPSLEDNFPNTILESLSCGTPVVAFDVGGVKDIIAHENNGLLAPVGDAAAMAANILSILFNDEKRQQMGLNGRDLIVNSYSLNIQSKGYLDLYETVIEENRSTKVNSASSRSSKFTDGEMFDDGGISLEGKTLFGQNFNAIYEPVLFDCLKLLSLELYEQLAESDADRLSRHKQIEKLTHLAKQYEKESQLRNNQINELTADLKKSEKDRQQQIDELRTILKEIDADRAARLEQIHELTTFLKESEADREARLTQIHELGELLKENEADRASRLTRIQELEANLEIESNKAFKPDVLIKKLKNKIVKQ